jgi:hypothetical protein
MSRTDDETVREAHERFRYARDWCSVAHQHYRDDYKFAYGDSENGHQWDSVTTGNRQGRPTLTVNKTRVHNLQIVNDSRQNKPQIKISPVGDNATYDAAQIFEGICRHVEYVSQAPAAYDTAVHCAVFGGIGYWLVRTKYVDDASFDLDAFIQRIPDPLGVYLDPDIQQYDGSDARWGFYFRDMARDDFEAEYPEHASDTADPSPDFPLDDRSGWSDGKHVRVAEYWRKGKKDDELLEWSDGTVVRASELGRAGRAAFEATGQKIVQRRAISVPEVEWLLIAGYKVLKRRAWPGKYIPIVRMPCEEVITDDGNKVDWVSHTRHLRDPQRLYNWYTSSAAEFVALQGKAPYIGAAAAVEPFKNAWETANVQNPAVLLYRHIDDHNQPLPPPQRAPPPVMAQAYMEGLKISQAELMMVSGQYQAVMGAPSNETSGTAINARQRQGDNATYHVLDHLSSAIRYTGRILIDMVPRIYDNKRIIMIMAEDGSTSRVHVDPQAPAAHATVPTGGTQGMKVSPNGQADPQQAAADAVATIFNPSVGRYEVVAEVGPSYGTRRAEAFNAYSQILAQNHNLFTVIGDLMMRAADFPGADDMAERLRNMVPPQALGGPGPEVQQLQAQLEHTTQTAQQLLQKADAELAHVRAALVQAQEQAREKGRSVDIDDYKAETERLKAVAAADPGAAQVLIRSMLSDLLGMPALPVMHEHMAADAAHQQSLAPPEPDQDDTGGAGPPGGAPAPMNGQGGMLQ